MLLQRLLRTDLRRVGGIRTALQLHAEIMRLRLCHLLAEHHRHRKILLHIARQIAGCEDGEHHHAQEYEHEGGTDAEGDYLQSAMAATFLLAFIFCHFLSNLQNTVQRYSKKLTRARD